MLTCRREIIADSLLKSAPLTSRVSPPKTEALKLWCVATGVALNLTAASHVFLIDIWWNPACEVGLKGPWGMHNLKLLMTPGSFKGFQSV